MISHESDVPHSLLSRVLTQRSYLKHASSQTLWHVKDMNVARSASYDITMTRIDSDNINFNVEHRAIESMYAECDQ